MTFATRALVAGAMLLGLTVGAHATVVYDNLSQTPQVPDSLASDGPIYASFTTGAGGLDLTDVELLLSGGSSAGSALIVTLFSDTGGSGPGSSVAHIRTALDSDVSASSPTPYDFQMSTGISLAANTTYWIGVTDSGTAQWFYNTGLGGIGASTEFFQNASIGFSPNDFPGFPQSYQMCISDGTGAGGCPVLPSDQVFTADAAAPEPASLAILGVAVLGLGAARRRYKVQASRGNSAHA